MSHLFVKFFSIFLFATSLIGIQDVQGSSSDSAAPIDVESVCDLDQIYNDYYAYSLPREVLESFISGRAFDHPGAYTLEEAVRLREDICEIYQAIIDSKPSRSSIAVLSAGAPGAGKTTLMRQKLALEKLQGRHFAYICPDDVCLKSQVRTYLADIKSGENSFAVRKAGYTKWRPASNAATHLILARLIKDKIGFYFGTTSSSPMANKLMNFLKEQGYTIKIIYVAAPDAVRWGSIQERDKSFVQTTKRDTFEKGLMMPERLEDTFLKYADVVEFYFRDAVDSDAVHAATWSRSSMQKGTPATHQGQGQLHIFDRDAYKSFKHIHNELVLTIGKPELKWNQIAKRFFNKK